MKAYTLVLVLCVSITSLTASNPVWQRVGDFPYSRIAATSGGFIAMTSDAIRYSDLTLRGWKTIDTCSPHTYQGMTNDPHFSAMTSFADTVYVCQWDPFVPFGQGFPENYLFTFYDDHLVRSEHRRDGPWVIFKDHDTLLTVEGEEGFQSLSITYSASSGVYLDITPNTFGWISDGVVINGDIILLSNQRGVLRSKDNGTTWIEDSTLRLVRTFYENENVLYAGTNDSIGVPMSARVYSSTDAGKTWTDLGFRGTKIKNLTVRNGTLYVAADSSLYATSLPVSVEQQTTESDFVLTPNPASQFVQLNSCGGDLATLSNALGEKIWSRRLFGSTETIDTHDIPDGIYLLTVEERKGLVTRVLCISH